MKKLIALFCTGLIAIGGISVADTGKLYDYQNYNHGYCPECSCTPCECQSADQSSPCPPACDPCASACGADCGISMCALGIGLAALAAAAAIIVSSGNGSTSHTS
ncbi:MAG: hypothetical protein KR126chlam2_01394 [Chlamydiae bacterium]|nr:hypothetical protein [Chlamydiota bacterium]